MGDHRFANILLTGPCNLRCPTCIGRTSARRFSQSTLDLFPLPGLEAFADELAARGIRQVSLTGIDTEPQLYRHQARLLSWLRARIPQLEVSLHTNGTRVLSDPALFQLYDRATISLPSFEPRTCAAMTGSPRVLDLAAILRIARIPIKVSTLLTSFNQREIPGLVRGCRELGVRRIVLRKLCGGGSPEPTTDAWRATGVFAGNPVFDVDGMELTIWDFARTHLPCLNLMPDGTWNDDYLLPSVSREAAAPLEERL